MKSTVKNRATEKLINIIKPSSDSDVVALRALIYQIKSSFGNQDTLDLWQKACFMRLNNIEKTLKGED